MAHTQMLPYKGRMATCIERMTCVSAREGFQAQNSDGHPMGLGELTILPELVRVRCCELATGAAEGAARRGEGYH